MEVATLIEKQKIVISLSPEELGFMCNAINETLEAVEGWEFHTRTGETPERAKEFLSAFVKALDEVEKGRPPKEPPGLS